MLSSTKTLSLPGSQYVAEAAICHHPRRHTELCPGTNSSCGTFSHIQSVYVTNYKTVITKNFALNKFTTKTFSEPGGRPRGAVVGDGTPPPSSSEKDGHPTAGEHHRTDHEDPWWGYLRCGAAIDEWQTGLSWVNGCHSRGFPIKF